MGLIAVAKVGCPTQQHKPSCEMSKIFCLNFNIQISSCLYCDLADLIGAEVDIHENSTTNLDGVEEAVDISQPSASVST